MSRTYIKTARSRTATRKLQSIETASGTYPIPPKHKWVPRDQQEAIARRFFDFFNPDGAITLARRCDYSPTVIEAICRDEYWRVCDKLERVVGELDELRSRMPRRMAA